MKNTKWKITAGQQKILDEIKNISEEEWQKSYLGEWPEPTPIKTLDHISPEQKQDGK